MNERAGSVPKVVIIGGGFGRTYAAKSLGRAPVRFTLIDRRNFHLFQPLLSGCDGGDYHRARSRRTYGHVLRHNDNTNVLREQVVDPDIAKRRVCSGMVPLATIH